MNPPPNICHFYHPASPESAAIREMHRAWGQAWAAEQNVILAEKQQRRRITQGFITFFTIGVVFILFVATIFG